MFDGMNEGHGEGDEPLVFHYSRNERLKSAPENVQNLYNGNFHLNKGFFKVLVATKMNRIMLLMVAFCLVIVLITATFGNKPEIGVCGGFEAELSCFSYDDSVYASVKLHPLKKHAEDKDFIKSLESAFGNVKFDFYDADGQLVDSRTADQKLVNGECFVRTMVSDYDIVSVTAEVQVLGETVSVKNRIKKRE